MKPAWGWPGCVALSSLLTELPGHFHLQAPGCLSFPSLVWLQPPPQTYVFSSSYLKQNQSSFA